MNLAGDDTHGSEPPRPSTPTPTNYTRSGRSVRFPRRFDDYLPGMRTVALAHIPSKENRIPAAQGTVVHPDALGIPDLDAGVDDNSESRSACDEPPLDDAGVVTTEPDRFGIYRIYARKPLYDPSQYGSLNTPCDALSGSNCRPGITPNQGRPHLDMQATPYYHPFSSPSAAAMMVAHHSGGPVQSIQQTNRIAHILGSLGPDLNPMDLATFDAALEHKRLDVYLANRHEGEFHREDGWLESSVRIRLPLDQTKMPESSAAEFEVGGLFHRDIIDVISSVFQSDAVKSFNHVPFKEYWKPSEDAQPERLYGEIYTSQAMIEVDDSIRQPCPGNDSDSQELEAVSVPLLLYSDSTHLASFGSASSWPVYLFFGSQSKYVRAMPTSYACHHIAYMPEVRHNQELYTSVC